MSVADAIYLQKLNCDPTKWQYQHAIVTSYEDGATVLRLVAWGLMRRRISVVSPRTSAKVSEKFKSYLVAESSTRHLPVNDSTAIMTQVGREFYLAVSGEALHTQSDATLSPETQPQT